MSALALSIAAAAKAVGQSPDTIKRAIRATDPATFPPPLRAKRAGKAANAAYLIPVTELERWVQSLPDA